MGAIIAYGKYLSYDGDYIGINSVVKYRDQRGNEANIEIKKFVELAKECKNEDNKRYFGVCIPLIESNKLAIGVFIIEGLDRIGKELGEKVYTCIK